ncbi:PREDICTED: putative disease resistance [Prunus dulcis]|uniref:PREDICTED: putative disease resistance n=1 Tax=Prunus dulcis TaxID=3755 RepID=A0A5E4EMG9_PRUDU|nr:putative disease resistance protein RGA3 [Prunus dulcis]VVA16270.1 PREDICTED: putative disease resistance [Prunus dulcis]
MAEALVSVVLEQLVSIARKQIGEEVRLVVNVDREVENLIFHFNAIQAVLQDAEERQVKEARVRNWLRSLEDVSYDINDLLDEWNTEILKHQIEKEEKEGVALTKRKKVCLFIPSPSVCCGCGPVDKVVRRHDIAKRIKETHEKLTDIANSKQNYNFHENTTRATEKLERVETSSFVEVSSIIGREEEKKRLISMLLSESSQQERSPFVVIPIVGMGGLGKTAFAQLVYNDDENIKTHFDTRIWVCVSDPFEEIKIARAIAQALNKDDNRINSTSLQPLLECINEYISGKKLFLVLDDVWNPTIDNWEPLMGALQNSAIGSRILVTTRNETVAAVMGATADHVIHLNILSDQDCLQLFNKIAFFDRERDDQLEDIGRKIVKKCNGLPLAAKTLASLMRYKKNRQEWVDVLDSKIWDLKEIEQQVFRSLFLSYYELTPAIRRCLLYCATFPKDYEFNKYKLIQLWMSNNYLSTEGDKEKQTLIGECYFDNLVMRSFFQDFDKDKEDNIVGCKMHDIVHDFVQFLTKHECIVMEVGCDNERNKVLNDKVRHLCLTSISDGSFPVSIYSCNRLRTLIASGLGLSALSSDLVLQLKCLRTLDLSDGWITDVSKEIGVLIHLRYLNLSLNPKLEELPDTVGNLCNLQTLELGFCSALKTLPVTIRKLINLKHLNLEGCKSLKVPKEIGRLKNLETLHGLILDDDVDENKGLIKLGDLGNLDQLRDIWIHNLKSVQDVSEVNKALFVNKKNLNTLLLNFIQSMYVSESEEGELQREMDEKILNAFQPHTNLERLFIGNYHGLTLRLNWMTSLLNLKTLVVFCLPFCELLPPLGKLPSLESLRIWYMRSLKKLGVDFLGIDGQLETPLFPKLKKLWFKSMVKWEDWEGIEGHREGEDSEIKIMPSLSTLKIKSCPNLKAVPDFLWKTPLQKLFIRNCENILQGCETASGRQWDKVSHIPNIKINHKYVQKNGVRMEPETTEIS